MSADEIARFVTGPPARPAVLATVRADGRAHAAPVWIDLDDDGTVVFTTHVDSVKGRNLARTGRATLVVDDDQPPFSFVVLEGPVEIVDDDPTALLHWSTRIGGRYMGPELADAYGRRNAAPGELIVRLRPERSFGEADVAD
jgi:PPOX class probable F420-dependent enzyme